MADETRAAPGRWMRIVLVVSLALNLAVAGLVIGGLVRGHAGDGRYDGQSKGRSGGERPPQVLRGLGPVPFLAALSEPDRTALMAAATARAPDLRPSREALRGQFEDILSVLRAETFDAGAMAGHLAELRAVGSARLEIGEALLLDRFAAMTPDERAAYADRLDKSLSRGGKRR